MTPHPPDPERDPERDAERLDDLAAFALDAVDLDEAVTIEARLLTDPAAAAIVRDLHAASGALAESQQGDGGADVAAATAALRHRVLSAAHAARPPAPVEAASAIEVHRIEMERAVEVLRRLRADQWDLPLDPPEFAGWTIRDLAAHLAANEGLAVQVLGLDEPVLPEIDDDNEARTRAVIARHRAMTPAATVDELEACARAVDEHVTALGPDGIEAEIRWWDMGMSIRSLLVVRSFETWTHADDIRRAIGRAPLAPPAPSLACMSEVAAGWAPLMVAATGRDLSGRSVELHLTGPGGGVHHVAFDLDERDLRGRTPDVVLTINVLDYCRAVGDRVPVGGVAYEAIGDHEAAGTLVGALNALATL